MSATCNVLLALFAVVIGACAGPPTESIQTRSEQPPVMACEDVTEPPEAEIHAYFHCAGAELDAPRPVPRGSLAADPRGRLEDAVRGLLQGPSDVEREAGYISFFSEQTALALNSVELGADGVVIVDFADLRMVMNNASTTTGSQILLAQLEATVFQIPEVDAVEYRIHGSCDTFWEWLQRACEVVPRP